MIKQLFLGLAQLLHWLYFDNNYNDPNGYVTDTKVFLQQFSNIFNLKINFFLNVFCFRCLKIVKTLSSSEPDRQELSLLID